MRHRCASLARQFGLLCAWSALLLLGAPAQAVVNLKNGNFNIAYDDLVVSAESGLKLSRYYNSLSANRGWFGVGWGTQFETRLFVMPDGLVAVHENGNAHITFYGEAEPAAVQQAVGRIVKTMLAKGSLTSEQEAAMRRRLKEDPLLRLQWAERYQLVGAPPAIGVRLKGAEYQSALDRFAETSDSDLIKEALRTGDVDAALLNLKHAYIAVREDLCAQLVRTTDGFERGVCSNTRFGEQQGFDVRGRLTRLSLNDNWLRLAYGDSQRPERIVDESGRAIELKWNERGFVSQISGPVEGKPTIVDFEYDGAGNLTVSSERKGIRYEYGYDRRHNMTSILYVDETKKLLEYDDKDRVTHITQRDGKQARFSYETNAQGDTETVYKKQSGDSLREVRRMRYNSKGQLLLDRDQEDDTVVAYEYHPTLGVVTRYSDDEVDCRYEYNGAGKVTRERCPAAGIDNDLRYDDAGNVTRVAVAIPEAARKNAGVSSVVIAMRYDAHKRIARIGDEGGSVYVTMIYADAAATEGEPKLFGADEKDWVSISNFQKKVDLVTNAQSEIAKRTSINDGFVAVRE